MQATDRLDLLGVLRSLLTPEGLQSPYPVYEQLRWARRECRGGRILVDQADVTDGLTDRRLSADVGVARALDWLADGDATTAIGVFVETVGDGRSFVDAASRVSANKPVVALNEFHHREA